MFNQDVETLLKDGGVYIGPVVGNSMRPFLCPNRDHVDIRPITGKIKTYEAVLYRRTNGQYVLHRIIGKNSDGYILRGDHQYNKEKKIASSCIIGTLNGYWKNVGTKKETYVNCHSVSYRCLIILWQASFPIRRIFRYCVSVIKAVFKKFKEVK